MSYDSIVSFKASDEAFDTFTARVEITAFLNLWDKCPTDGAEASLGQKVIGDNIIDFLCSIRFSKDQPSFTISVQAVYKELSAVRRMRGSIIFDNGAMEKGDWQDVIALKSRAARMPRNIARGGGRLVGQVHHW